MSLTASQARDIPAELTVDRVVAALQDLWQHLEHSQKDLKDARKKIQALKLKLSTTQAQRDYFSGRNQELQKELAERQEVMWRAELQKNSLETALKEEATARKEEAITLHQEVASLQRKLENTEKERKDVLVCLLHLQLAQDQQHQQNDMESCAGTSQELSCSSATANHHCVIKSFFSK
ncbi:hypothetical protein HGM15179_018385 [Zosterops borbonicus]|uniref:Uncharacterized protein n=1 Tax=Zosterops borbonicus TaxID=364589 RepID=A0A8K1FZ51_9PASS|nr:hypothetical protein HGM15179_018385 [Zosterops borbonicus]